MALAPRAPEKHPDRTRAVSVLTESGIHMVRRVGFNMWAGLEANLPVVNGYSGTIPPKWILLNFNTIGPDRDRARIRDWLNAWMREFPEYTAKPVVIEVP